MRGWGMVDPELAALFANNSETLRWIVWLSAALRASKRS